MDDLTAIHPQLRSIVNKTPQLHFNRFTLFAFRQIIKLFPRSKIPDDVNVENISIARNLSKDKLKVRVYRPEQQIAKTPVLIWIHGGGLVFGNPILNDSWLIQFVQALGIVIVSVDYRLAPEHPFPLPLEDCYSALKWIYDHADDLAVDNQRISIGGESAGGGLAAALTQLALDRGEISLKFQLLVYPMLDDRSAVNEKFKDKAYIGWNQKNNYFGWESYLGKAPGGETAPDYAVPGRRKNLAGLPAAWICCGTLDLFYEEDEDYCNRLLDAGVNCEFESMEGVFHGFDSMYQRNPFVITFREKQIAVLKGNLF